MRLLLLMALLLPACSTTSIPKFKANITLPASEDGYWMSSVRGPVPAENEGRIPKAEWEAKRKHGIVLLSEDWKILRDFLLKNCLENTCKYMVGTFDSMFMAIDSALQKLPSGVLK